MLLGAMLNYMDRLALNQTTAHLIEEFGLRNGRLFRCCSLHICYAGISPASLYWAWITCNPLP